MFVIYICIMLLKYHKIEENYRKNYFNDSSFVDEYINLNLMEKRLGTIML